MNKYNSTILYTKLQGMFLILNRYIWSSIPAAHRLGAKTYTCPLPNSFYDVISGLGSSLYKHFFFYTSTVNSLPMLTCVYILIIFQVSVVYLLCGSKMVLDQVFGQLVGGSMEPDLSYIEDSKEILNEMSMDLDDFKFDFDTISDSLGPWIQTNDLKLDIDSDLQDDSFFNSDSIDFEDLNISEAVRYDCMWSSNPAPAPETKKQICENTLFEEFLKIIDSPSQFELEIKEENTETEAKPLIESSSCDKSLSEEESKVRSFSASLDHCYVSSSLPSSNLPQYPTNLLDTPPESSEDEDTQTIVPFPHILNPAPTSCIQSQSLLKSPRSRIGGEPKFCFRVKLKSDKSRSVLKQKLNLSSSPVKRLNLGIMNKNMVQTSIRRRKEESLKVKHHEAREIHNHMERQRRNELKVAFDELKACIPDIATSEKVSKQMILDTALQNCKLLRSREISMKLRKEKLKKANAELKQKLLSLQGLC